MCAGVTDNPTPPAGVATRAHSFSFRHTTKKQDPLIVARLLVVGRDCLLQTQYKVSGLP